MDLNGKKIGVLGFGVVGKSVLGCIKQFTDKIEILDQNKINEPGIYQNPDLENFLEVNDFIIPSPGIDLRNYYRNYKGKFIFEIDLFYHFFNYPTSKKIIALTGTIGKTSVVNLIHQLFNNLSTQYKVGLGGNVGIAMLDLLKDDIDIALLEISSFQLEHANNFAPDLAIWTNFFPNHLDRHGSLNEYFLAKFNLIKYQNVNQKALIPLNLIEKIRESKPKAQLFFFAENLDHEKLKLLTKDESLFFIEDGFVKLMSHNSVKKLFDINNFPKISFLENWLIIYAAFYLEGIELKKENFEYDFKIPEHRLEKFTEFNGATFYNDSKSTVIESTLNAIKKLKSKNLILILGGLSKGADRSILIKECVGKVKKIYLFGKEAENLQHFCDIYKMDSYKSETLEQVVENLFLDLKNGDEVLFSPAGSSYDLFKNYEERGKAFKDLVFKKLS